MRFGVNYTPRVGWFHHWLDFDARAVAQDFDTIAELGADHVRVFPLWPIFQPNASFLNPAAFASLETMITLAGESGLSVAVDGLQGHLSSFDFLPSWIQTWHRRNMFTDADVMTATANYLTELAAVSGQHDNVFALTVGNEVSQFTGGLHPDPFPATSAEVTTWLDMMLGALRSGAPDRLIVHSSYDASWFEPAQPFTLTNVGQQGDESIVHSWVFNQTAQLYGPDAFETHNLARYLVETVRAFHVDPNRKIWMQEVGAPHNVIPHESTERFIHETIASLAPAPDLSGITWWCSHDVNRSLTEFPELEYTLGLIDETGAIKPEGRFVQEAIAHAREVAPVHPTASIDLAFDGPLSRARLAPGGEFFEDYMNLAKSQGHPRVARVTTDDGSI